MLSFFPWLTISFLLISWLIPQTENQKDYDLTLLKQKFEEIKSHPNTKDADLSFFLLNPNTKQVLLEHNARVLLIPASALKIVTTASAMYLLDTSYRFQTTLSYTGIINEDGWLIGNLIIKGAGDPTLASPYMAPYVLPADSLFASWFKALQALGIRGIEGNIIADASFFDNQLAPDCWGEDDIGNYYGAGACGLSFHENFYTLYFQAGKKQGQAAKLIGTSPPTPELIFDNKVTTGPKGSGDRVIVFGAPSEHQRRLRGTVPLGQDSFAVRGSHPDPAYMAARMFHEFLQQKGIEISGTTNSLLFSQTSVENPAYLITTSFSPSLRLILERTNQKSVNTFAENLLKTIGKEYNGQGSFSSGIHTIKNFWAKRGVDIMALQMVDGSGLSRENKITAECLGQILSHIYQDAELYPYFKSTLSVAGQSGTLERTFSGSPAKEMVWAKSGYMKGVRSYAGYVRTQRGEILVFVFIVNGFKGTAGQMRQQMVSLIESISKLE